MDIGRKEKKTVVITAVVVGSDSISSASSSSNCKSQCPGVTVMSEVKVLKYSHMQMIAYVFQNFAFYYNFAVIFA